MKWLGLGHCTEITDQGLVHLERLKELQVLSLHSNDNITDDGLAYLSGLTNMRRLSLDGCSRITDDGLYHFRDMSQLSELSLKDCEEVGVHDVNGLAMLLLLEQMAESGYTVCKK